MLKVGTRIYINNDDSPDGEYGTIIGHPNCLDQYPVCMDDNDDNYADYFLEGKEVSTQGGVKYQAVGKTIAERAYNYLLDCGLTASQLDAIRNTFLEE